MSLLDEIPADRPVTVDSAPLIYVLDGDERFAPRYLPLFEAAERGDLSIVLSSITVAEVLVGPLLARDEPLAQRYLDAMHHTPNWTVWPVDLDVAQRAARIRAQTGLRLPDAIQAATALASGSSALVTHDRDFARVADVRVVF